jgi:hypothetical protein
MLDADQRAQLRGKLQELAGDLETLSAQKQKAG